MMREAPLRHFGIDKREQTKQWGLKHTKKHQRVGQCYRSLKSLHLKASQMNKWAARNIVTNETIEAYHANGLSPIDF